MSNDNLMGNRPSTSHTSGSENGNRRHLGCLKLIAICVASVVLLIVALVLLIDFTDSGDRVKKGVVDVVEAARGPGETPEPEVVERVVEKVVEKIVEVEKKEPLPSRYVDRRTVDTVELWNGLTVTSAVQTEQGELATVERDRDESFQLELELTLTIPKADTSLADLAKLNPDLPKQLPALERMLPTAKISPFYHALYEAKAKRVQQYLTRLDRILSRHNFYDCETMLELTHPDTGQRALLIQSEMDVVSDGSDGDRWPELDDYISMSDNYRYSTSYAWPKRTATPNPMLARTEASLKQKEARFSVAGLSIEENRQLRSDIEELTVAVGEMKARSFLIAEADPFIVLPLSMLGRMDETPFGPMIGDYAVVFYHGKAYPAIAGDAGPTFQVGEASLRLAKALNENAGVYTRPESDLKVTYLVFPQSAEKKKGPPDLEKWRETCARLLDGIGGLGEGYELHQWEDLISRKRAEKTPATANPPAPSPDSGGAPREVRPLPSGGTGGQ
ncbi:MAG: hypothetical protein KDN19_02805 [Verrucomicrobiae bacterium]|nr:hypothetical protein [Verrucomicrobiae bacterium]